MNHWIYLQVWQLVLAAIGSGAGGVGALFMLCGTNQKSRFFGLFLVGICILVTWIPIPMGIVAGGG